MSQICKLMTNAFLVALLCQLVSIYSGASPVVQAAACTGSSITGVVFRDYNANGVQESSAGGFTEPGIGGIVVTAYDANGTTASCESTATGAYGIDPLGAFPVRLEFTLPADGSLNFLKPGAAGGNGRTTVSFVNAPTANINAGFAAPADFCGATPSPELATSCMVFGEQNDNPASVNKDQHVMYAFPYGAGSADLTNETAVESPAPRQLALAKQLGAVWGLAWHPQTQTIYAAAFMKRHVGFGPGGPGAIYQITAAGAVSIFHNFGAAAGADPHPLPTATCARTGAGTTNGNCWFFDTNAFDQVGKVAFGDLDMSEDFSTLYTINLANKTLLAMPVANPASAATFPLPAPANCTAADVRPFGLGVKDGKVYIGMVCSAESTTRMNLRAYVYAFANSAFAATPTLEINLANYRTSGNIQWQAWLNSTTYMPSMRGSDNTVKWGQPWLTDIAFDGNDMILTLRDRNADLFGTRAGGPNNIELLHSGIARGDILRACANGSGGWQLENKGSCGGVTTAGATGHTEGPGGGEYYYEDEQREQSNLLHAETSLGAVAQIPGLPDVVSTIYNPVNRAGFVSDTGIKWYNNRTGATSRGYRIYDGSPNPDFFSKANGLGDLEALCPAAPLEIGNRVWRDDDGDGVQDPGEPGLDGVTVELYRDGVLVGTVTTTSGGQYLFNDSNVTLNGAGGIVAGLCGPNGASVYEVRIPNATGGSQQAPLAGLTLTQGNNGGAPNGALRDSNGTLVGTGAVYAIPCSDLSAPGFNNHTYDFGFTPAQTHSLGNYIWIDANNDGLVTTGEVAVPNGVVVELLAADGTPTGQTTQTTNGFYLFSGLTAGSYRVRLAASNFQVGGLLASYTSSTGVGQEANPDANGDQNDNGLDSGVPATDGIVSAVITLGSDEPTGESPTANGTPGSDGAGTADANSNLTVDFGLVPPPVELVALGNVVFRDINNNGRIDGSESGIDGVQVALFPAGADPLTTAPIATATTSGGGFYLFDNLTPGQYFVYLRPSNFQANGVLAGYLSSTGSGTSDSADDNVDENGIDGPDLATNGVRSIVYDLQPNSEPTGESGAGVYGGILDDNNVNMTADFGVYMPLCLGNRVWRDDGAGGGVTNNGVLDGAEQGIANVVVRLLDGAGNPVLGANGQPLMVTTDAQGYYFFCNLLPGSYIVLIDASNFAVGGPLRDLNSSDPTESSPDSDNDLNDNGINVPNPATTGIRSGVVNLAYNSEPTNENDLGPIGTGQVPNSNNLTVDFGFFPTPTNEEEAQEPMGARRLFLPVAVK